MKKNNLQKYIPTGWQEAKLGDVLMVGSGKDYKHLEKGDIPVFGTGGHMLSVDKPLYSGETVFIGRKGTIDKPFYFKGDFWTVDTLFYTYNYKNTTAKYINFVFQKINWKLYNEASGVPSLSKNTIEKIKFIFPSLSEQKRIVAMLEGWDHAIEKLTRKIKVKKNVKKGLMQNLLTGKVRLVGFKDKWRMIKLGDVARVIMGQSPSSSAYNENRNGLPLIQGNNDIKKGKTIERIWTTKITKQVGHETIIMTVRAPVGSIGISSGEICIGRGVCGIIPEKINKDFLLKFLESCESIWRSLEQGSTFSAISGIDIRNLEISVPISIKEQDTIADILVISDNEIEALEKKLTILKEQKKYLLNNLITGIIRTKA